MANNNLVFKANIWKMYLFEFFVSLHFMDGVLVPFFTDWGHLSLFQVMLLQAWFMLCVFLLEIPTGTIADFLGRKQSLLLGAIANIIAVIIYTSTPSFYVFLIGEFLWALSNALFSGADDAFAYDTLKKINEQKKSKKILGRIETSKLIGYMVGAPIGSIIAASIGLQMPMLLMAIPLTIAFFIGLTLKEPKTKQKALKYFDILKQGIKFFYTHKTLKILAIDMVFITTIGYFMIWLYQPMLKQAGINIVFFGIVHSIFVASEIIFINANEKIEKILKSKKKILFLSSIITGIIFIIGGLTTLIPIVLLTIFIGGGLSLSRKPIFVSYMNKHIPSQKRATILSTIFMLRTLTIAIANPLVGLSANWSLNNTLIIIGTITIIFSFASRLKEEHLID